MAIYFNNSFVQDVLLEVLTPSFLFPACFFCWGYVREWSIITGRGGLQNGRGGHVKFYPYEKGGRKKF